MVAMLEKLVFANTTFAGGGIVSAYKSVHAPFLKSREFVVAIQCFVVPQNYVDIFCFVHCLCLGPFPKSAGMFAALVLQRDATLVVVKSKGQ